jgi:hypothetical protein
VRVTDKPYKELRGLRVGTGFPWVIVLGKMIYRGGKDFVAIYGTGRTVILELAAGEQYKRIFVSGVPTTVLEQVQAAVNSAQVSQSRP